MGEDGAAGWAGIVARAGCRLWNRESAMGGGRRSVADGCDG